MPSLELVDPRTNRYLSGRFAPVHREITVADLEVEGDLPADLTGAYVRNGPDPKFPPLGSYTYPMEGDGMLHAVWLEGGLDAFINVVRHACRYLALEEGTPPYEVNEELATVGRYDFAGELAAGMCAHPKVDPQTGDMVVFRYDIEAPFLTWAVIGADGHVSRSPVAVEPVDCGSMIHDCAITEHFLVLVLGPAVFDLAAMSAGGPLLKWRPELGTRVAVVSRDGDPVRWIESDPFWVWHLANAHEDGGKIHVDFPEFNTLGFLDPHTPVTGAYTHATLDPAAGTMTRTVIRPGISEFPRIDDRLIGRRHRYVTVGAASGAARTAGEHDVLCRVDLETGACETYDTGAVIGEVVFAPRPGGTAELDGYYVTQGTSLDDGHSALYLWDADAFPGPPRARVCIPQRVPNGLHGNWFAAT